jgi:hypothetical protein
MRKLRTVILEDGTKVTICSWNKKHMCSDRGCKFRGRFVVEGFDNLDNVHSDMRKTNDFISTLRVPNGAYGKDGQPYCVAVIKKKESA